MKRIVFGGIVLLLAVLSSVALLIQNRALQIRVEHQSTLITAQSQLIDSIKGSSAGLKLNSLISAIDNALSQSDARVLDAAIIARIASFSRSLSPYHFSSGDSLSLSPVSPERGQLLVYLQQLRLDTTTLDRIAEEVIFDYADLRGTDLRTAYLCNMHLRYSDMQDAQLDSANLELADIRESNLWGINAPNAKFNRAKLNRTDLRWANLSDSEMRNVDLNGVNLRSGRLRRADLTGARLQWADLSYASFRGAVMENVNMMGTKTYAIDLRNANISNGHLRRVNFINANLEEADLTGVYLSETLVPDTSWLRNASLMNIIGFDSIRSSYQIIAIKEGRSTRFELAFKD